MSEEIVKGQATYWGGHFLHPGSERGDVGKITKPKAHISFVISRSPCVGLHFAKGLFVSGDALFKNWRGSDVYKK